MSKTRFQLQLRLARLENREVKDFNRLMKQSVTQDRDFHVDVDDDRSWNYDGLQITRGSKIEEAKSIGRSRDMLVPEYVVWIPDCIPATRWEPEVHDAHEHDKRFADLEDALFECFKLNEQHRYRDSKRCEWEAEESRKWEAGEYEMPWD